MEADFSLLKQLLSKPFLSLEMVKTIPFPMFIRNELGHYVYLSKSLESHTDLSDFLNSTRLTNSPLTLEWMSNDLHLFENGGFLDKIYQVNEKVLRVFKFIVESSNKKYLVGFAADITKVQEERQNSYVLERILQNLPEAIIVAENKPSEDFPIVMVNDEFSRLTGYSLEDVRGKNCRLLQGTDTDLKLKAEIKSALKSGKSFRGTILNYKKNGTPFWNSLSINPIYDPTNKRITHFLGIQVEVEEDEVATAKPFTDFIDNLPTLLISLDEQSRVTDINDYALKYLEYEEEEFLGHTLADFLDRESKILFTTKIFPLLKLRQSLLNERLVLVKKNEEKIKFIVSAKQTKDCTFVLVFTEVFNLTHPDKFVPPESGPW